MWHSRDFLKICDTLHRAGSMPSFEMGTVVARGFADLGFEEYCILTENRLLSLFTGSISELVEDQKHHFFQVYTPDQLLNEIHLRGWDVSMISSADHRLWTLAMRESQTGEELVVEENSHAKVLAKALLSILERGMK